MPTTKNFETITVSDGGNYVVNLATQVSDYWVTGTDTLTGGADFPITTTGTPVDGMTCVFRYEATVTTTTTETVTFFGTDMPLAYIATKCVVIARYNGSDWTVVFTLDFDQAGIVTTTNILDGTILNADISATAAIAHSKLADLTRGSIISGQTVSDVPTALALGTTAQLLCSDATDISWTTVSGDVTMVSGVFTIANTAVENTMINTNVVGNGLTGGAGSAIDVLPDTTNGTSIAVSSDGVQLTNDSTAPGNSYFYGTNGSGTKGWFLQSTITAAATTLQAAFDNGTDITIANTDNQTLSITNNDITTTPNPDTVYITNATSGNALRIDQTGTTGKAIYIDAATGARTSTNAIIDFDIAAAAGSYTAAGFIDIDFVQNAALVSGYQTLMYNKITAHASDATNITGYTFIVNEYTTSGSNSRAWGYTFTPNGTISNSAALVYGFYYSGLSLTHTDGTECALYADMTSVAAGSSYGVYITGGQTNSVYLRQNYSGSVLYATQVASDANDCYGLRMDLSNGGVGTEYAFRFDGNEKGHTAAGNAGFDSNSVGTFVASGYILISIDGVGKYIPYGDIS